MNYLNLSFVLMASLSGISAAVAVEHGPVGAVTYICPKGSEISWYPQKAIKDYGIKYHATAPGGFGTLTTTLTGIPQYGLHAMFWYSDEITADTPQKQADGSWIWHCAYKSDFYETAISRLTVPASSRFSSCELVKGATSADRPPSIYCI